MCVHMETIRYLIVASAGFAANKSSGQCYPCRQEAQHPTSPQPQPPIVFLGRGVLYATKKTRGCLFRSVISRVCLYMAVGEEQGGVVTPSQQKGNKVRPL